MGEARPSLPSHSCIALLTGGLLLLTAFIFAAPAKHSTWPDLLNQFTPAQRLVVPWEPLLTREELLRGLSYYGTGARLQAVAAKLLAGQPIKVYTLGGSITRGGGARSEELKYVARFFNAINASFPHRDHVFANKGSSAATSFFFAPCMSYHAPEGADLVVVEFTMNDPYDGPLTTAVRRSYESIIRQLVARPDGPAILQLHAWSWWRPGKSPDLPDGVDHGLFYWPQGERDLTLFAHYYDFPSVSVRSGTFHLQNMGIEHFKVDKIAAAGWTTNEQRHYFAEPNGTVVEGKLAAAPADQNDQYFYSDDLHPHDTGHAVMAELLLHPLARAIEEVQAGRAVTAADRRGDPRLEALPPPMIPHSLDEQASLCAMLEDFKPMVVASDGFEYAPERPTAKEFADQKWGWRGTQPGAWAEMVLDTRSKTYQGSALVWLSHLKSYEGMGVALVECKEGCTCQPAKLDGKYDKPVSIFWMLKLFVSQHERCRLRVTITNEPAGQQGAHKVTLAAIMVTHIENMREAGTLASIRWINDGVKMG